MDRPRAARPFLSAVSEFVGYSFDETDWEAVAHQLEPGDEAVSTAGYSLGEQVKLELELEHGDGIVSYRATAPSPVEARIEGATAAFQATET